jgi:replication factor A1
MDTNYEAYEKAISDANFQQFLMKFKVADDTYNDETRVKVSLNRLDKVDYVAEVGRVGTSTFHRHVIICSGRKTRFN